MQQKECIINGIKIAYLEKKTDAISPLFVFLHGWGSSANVFADFFEKTPNAIALNFPPFGGSSDLPRTFFLDDFTDITKIFLEKHQKEHQKIVFVVHSFGGRVLLSLLQDKKIAEKTEKIIAIGVPFFRFRTQKHTIIEKISRCFQKKPWSYAKPLFKKILYTFWKNSDYEALGNNDILKRTFQNIISEDLTPLFSIFAHFTHHQIFLLWGEKDTAAPFENAKKMQKIFPAVSIFSFPTAGHFPFLEEKEKFFEVFKNIIERNT